jgi:hypothetical protein
MSLVNDDNHLIATATRASELYQASHVSSDIFEALRLRVTELRDWKSRTNDPVALRAIASESEAIDVELRHLDALLNRDLAELAHIVATIDQYTAGGVAR